MASVGMVPPRRHAVFGDVVAGGGAEQPLARVHGAHHAQDFMFGVSVVFHGWLNLADLGSGVQSWICNRAPICRIMSDTQPFTLLCLASYEKGHAFLAEAKRQGARVLLLTSLSLKEKAQWPAGAIDETFYMPDVDNVWNREDTLKSVAHLAHETRIDRIVALDEFDQEIAATLRAHLCLPGLDETTARRFRDKLYMRHTAHLAGIRVPEFVGLLNNSAVHEFTQRVAPPWVLKPRLMAGAIGIKKISSPDELWSVVHSMGDQQSFFLLEQYVPGNVCHVDSIVWDGEIVFRIASAYGRPPLDVSHGGGIFTTSILPRGSDLEQELLEENEGVLTAMHHVRGVSHTEFIVSRETGEIYFLESAARVGGAHIADLVEAATGLNLWAQWACVETATASYHVPPTSEGYAALIVSLAKQEHPDLSAYKDPEVVWRMDEKHHVGMILASPDHDRIAALRDDYIKRVAEDFGAVLPPADRPTH
jgi:phosphoribosylaminoimidazole carboxylase (NCAIR synthetase)